MKKGIIQCLVAGIIGSGATYIGCKIFASNKNYDSSKTFKFKTYYNMLNQWLELKNNDKNLEQYFMENEYKKIAIYGMGEMGIRLLEELKDSSVVIAYGIDKDGGSPFDSVAVYSIEDDLDITVDAVVVTAVFAFDAIEKELNKIFDCPILSLEDIVISI